MKTLPKALLCLALSAFLLTGCDTAGTSSENSSDVSAPSSSSAASSEPVIKNARDFCLSSGAAKLTIELSDSNAQLSELCAYYEDTATFKLSYLDGSAKFFTYKVLTDNGYSLKLVSSRVCDGFEKDCEFYPHAEDGYPESALVPCVYTDLFPTEFPAPQKILYYIIEVGAGQQYTNEAFIKRFIDAIDEIKMLPIERFITEYETLLQIENADVIIKFYDNINDESPSHSIIPGMFCQKVGDDMGKIYYPSDYSAVNAVYFETLAEIKDSNQSPQ